MLMFILEIFAKPDKINTYVIPAKAGIQEKTIIFKTSGSPGHAGG
jgi:hypothetical protein